VKRPLVGVVILYALGIWIGSWMPGPVEWWWWSAAGLLAAFFIFRRSAPAMFALVLVAGVVAYRDAVRVPPGHLVNVLGRQTQTALVRGVVASDTSGRRSFTVAVRAVEVAGEWTTAEGRLFVFLRLPRELRYGDLIEFSALVHEPEPARNPDVFDWRGWLERKRIYLSATIREKDFCEVREQGHGQPVVALSLRLRERLERAVWAGLEDAPGVAGVLAGMVIGERAEIPADTHAAFQRTGVFHVFAVSGLHVGLVTAVVLVGLRAARVPRRWSGLVAIPLLVLYVFATGARPGALRALVMACVWLTGWVLVRPSDVLNGLAGAALGILIWEPLQLFDGGFLLSFMVVVWLVTLTPGIVARLSEWVARDPLVPDELVPAWQRRLDKPVRQLILLVSGSVAAWVGLLPLMGEYFHLFTPISIAANVVVVPMLGTIMAVGLLAILTHGVWPWLAVTFNNANFALLNFLTGCVEQLGRVPFGHEYVPAPPVWVTVAYYAGLVLVASGWGAKIPRGWWGGSAVVAAGMLWWGGREDVVEVTVLDLSRGAAVFVNGPGEQEDFLLDGGDDWNGSRVVVPFLRAQGVDRLERVVLTRNDRPHAAGLLHVADEMPVRSAGHGGIWTRSPYYHDWLQGMERRGVPLQKARRGDEWTTVAGLRARVLHPLQGTRSTGGEDYVVVLLLEYGPTRVLLLGDASAAVVAELRETILRESPHVIVKGAGGCSWEHMTELLTAARPAAVVVQVPAPSGFSPSRPPPALPEELRAGVQLWRTDLTGAVTIRLTQRGFALQPCLPDATL